MSKFAIAAIDMDGTLLNSTHEITPFTQKILREVDAAGCKIVLCTGRIFHAVEPYTKQLGLDNFTIVGNGAQICKALSGEVVVEYLLPKDIIIKIAEVGKRHGGHPRVYGIDGRVYVETLNDSDIDYSNWTQTDVIPVGDFEKNLAPELIKVINVMPNDDAVTNVLRAVTELFGQEIYVTRGMLGFAECMSSKASKGNALRKLAEICSVPLEKIIVAGDHYNDLTMYDLPGVLGITCNNAQDVVKERAKLIGKSNDEDGIALLLQKLMEE